MLNGENIDCDGIELFEILLIINGCVCIISGFCLAWFGFYFGREDIGLGNHICQTNIWIWFNSSTHSD